jgi:hypothetical protein
VPNNDDYGTFEAPLNQNNDDPVSDFLYSSNFALLGLHEAAAALGNNATVKAEEDKLARYIVRIQARSTEHPEIDGAWMRAFDFEKWEAWASDADVGWGAWSVESGWTQSWITTTLGMRLLNVSLWELGQRLTTIRSDFDTWIPVMFTPPAPPPPPAPPLPCPTPLPCVKPAASGSTIVGYTLVTDLEPLCSDGTHKVHVNYTGNVCGPNGKHVQWTSATTLDPRAGTPPASCHWDIKDNPSDKPGWFGAGCGVCPTAVTLPTTVC